MRRPLNTLILALALAILPVAASANIVTCDYLPAASLWDASTNVPGDFIFSEDLADVYIYEFYVAGAPYFNLVQVDPASAIFGNYQILQLNNTCIEIDFTAAGNVTFEYLDLGGSVNLQVNGYATVLEANDVGDLVGTVAPGVTLNVSTWPVSGGHAGQATLTGPVQRLRIGGQEFWVDDLNCANGVSAPSAGCDYAVTHETLPVGTRYDAPVYSPGDWIFQEDGIDVLIDVLTWVGGGTGFNYCEVDMPGIVDFGFNRAMLINNVTNRYMINSLGIYVDHVTFEYLDYGGEENLQVNGATLHVGEITGFPVAVAPGVTMSVATYPVGPGGVRGEVTLIGNVQELLVGGQEFHIDEVCVVEGDEPECDHLVHHQSQALGTQWGGAYGHGPGDLAFVEENIPVQLEVFDWGGGLFFNECQIQNTFFGLGDGHVMALNNISNVYKTGDLGRPVERVTFDFLDMGGTENLQVNGATLYVGDITMAPNNIAPGVVLTVTTVPIGGGVLGRAVFEGDVQRLLVGGQEFWIDNICVELDYITGVGSVAPRQLTLNDNYPNPFNPRTTLSFALGRDDRVRLTIHDLAGRLVTTLVDGSRAAGAHQVIWDGRDSRGDIVAAGVYFVRVQTGGGEVQSQKVVLIK